MKTSALLIITLLFSMMGYSQSRLVSGPKLIFSYDTAGNQKTRIYCESDGSCNALRSPDTQEEVVKSIEEVEEIHTSLSNNIKMYPNPTKGNLSISWDANYTDIINDITIIDISSRSHKVNYLSGNHEVQVNLQGWPMGLYMIKFYLKGGKTIVKKIIKN